MELIHCDKIALVADFKIVLNKILLGPTMFFTKFKLKINSMKIKILEVGNNEIRIELGAI